MYASLRIATEPASEPVTVEEVRERLRLDTVDQDSMLDSLVIAARQAVEARIHRSLITRTLRLTLDAWPTTQYSLVATDGYAGHIRAARTTILLPMPPAIAVSGIVYVDENGANQDWAAANYRVDVFSEPARITCASGCSYPGILSITNAITITYTAGYGSDASSVPSAIRESIIMLACDLYEHPEASAEISLEENRAYKFLLNSYFMPAVTE